MPKISTTKITIDGQEYVVPVMKFKALKRAFPYITTIEGSEDLIVMSEAAHEVVSIALRQNKEYEHMTAEWIGDNIDVDENLALAEAIQSMLEDSGLIQKQGAGVSLSGEGQGAAPSTEISTPSSPNSSQPDAVAEIGTQ